MKLLRRGLANYRSVGGIRKGEGFSTGQIDGLHATYCEKLIDIFEKHKTNYGIGPEERIVLY